MAEWTSCSEGCICKGELAKQRSAPPTEVLHKFEKAKNVDVSDQDEYLDEWIEDLKKEILALQEKTWDNWKNLSKQDESKIGLVSNRAETVNQKRMQTSSFVF